MLGYIKICITAGENERDEKDGGLRIMEGLDECYKNVNYGRYLSLKIPNLESTIYELGQGLYANTLSKLIVDFQKNNKVFSEIFRACIARAINYSYAQTVEGEEKRAGLGYLTDQVLKSISMSF